MSYYRPRGFGGFSIFPPVIKNLLIINVIVFFFQFIGRSFFVDQNFTLSQIITKYFGLIPIEGFVVGRTNLGLIVWDFFPWQLITYQFLHGDFWHIFFNLFALWMFGMEIENLWGSKKFAYYYLLCGVVAGLFQLFIAPLLGSTAPTIGASGAVFGVLIAFAMLFPDRQIFIWGLFPIRAKYLIGFLIIINILSVNEPGNVAYLAHLGGAFAGFLFIMIDKNIDAPFKRTLMNLRSDSNRNSFTNPFGDITDRFKKKGTNVEDANYYEINDKKEESVSQEEIDRILDKISQSGYQNLSEKEKKILFEASKKMN